MSFVSGTPFSRNTSQTQPHAATMRSTLFAISWKRRWPAPISEAMRRAVNGPPAESRTPKSITDGLWGMRDDIAKQRRHAMLCQSARRAAAQVEPTVTWRTAHPHHRAASAADGRRVIGEHDLRPGLVRDIHEPCGNGGRARVQVDDLRPQTNRSGRGTIARLSRPALRRPEQGRDRAPSRGGRPIHHRVRTRLRFPRARQPRRRHRGTAALGSGLPHKSLSRRQDRGNK